MADLSCCWVNDLLINKNMNAIAAFFPAVLFVVKKDAWSAVSQIRTIKMPMRPVKRNRRRPNFSTKKAQKRLPGSVEVTHIEVSSNGM